MENAPADSAKAKKTGEGLLRACASYSGEIAEDYWKWKQSETL